MKNDGNCIQFYEICVQLSKARTSADVGERAGIAVGQEVSSRNTAMSRLADLLGVGDLLARSTSAEIKKDGRTLRGNLMEGARGEDFDRFAMSTAGVDVDVSSGELQRQFVCLQLLDSLCAQVDRHAGNYFLASEQTGDRLSVTSIEGIDNDMAFGTLTNLSEGKKELPPLVGEGSRLTIPYVDKDMVNRLQSITDEMVKFAVGDIITDPAELNALCARLAMVKDAVRNARSLERGEWGVGTDEAMRRSDNYYKRFVEKFSARRSALAQAAAQGPAA